MHEPRDREAFERVGEGENEGEADGPPADEVAGDRGHGNAGGDGRDALAPEYEEEAARDARCRPEDRDAAGFIQKRKAEQRSHVIGKRREERDGEKVEHPLARSGRLGREGGLGVYP